MEIKLLIIFFLLILFMFAFLKIARRYNINDIPNERSSHTIPTIRGGGIIIPIGLVIYSLFLFEATNPYLIVSVLLVSIISFLDDIYTLPSLLRFVIHFISITIVFYILGLFEQTFSPIIYCVFIVTAYILSIGYLNIYNFMDGINGITFLNSLITLLTLLYINIYITEFTQSELLIILTMSILIFGFLNFRKKALCFLGDIGSISLGILFIFFAIKLYHITNDLSYFLIFLVYSLDGGWTIIERICRKENILKAHRRHLYQLLVDKTNLSHLKVSTIYFVFQLIINISFLLLRNKFNQYIVVVVLFFICTLIYFIVKSKLIKCEKKKL